MAPSFQAYVLTVWAFGALGALSLVQLLVADAAAILARHPPGSPVEADPKRFLFRASRAFANTNESLAVFVVLALFATLSGASPAAVNLCSWIYVAGRTAHMLCYWADLRLARSVSFGVAVVGLVSLFITGVVAWL